MRVYERESVCVSYQKSERKSTTDSAVTLPPRITKEDRVFPLLVYLGRSSYERKRGRDKQESGSQDEQDIRTSATFRNDSKNRKQKHVASTLAYDVHRVHAKQTLGAHK
jgi:hypothetical protein